MSTGTILGFFGSWGSGMAQLSIDDDEQGHVMIPCENTSTVRALDSCFGDVIGPGRSVNLQSIKGKRIRYGLDDMGLMLGYIAPVEEEE